MTSLRSMTVARTLGALVILSAASGATASNILVNPGFETGDFTGWPHSSFAGNISISPGNGHSGGFGVKFSSVNSASLTMSQDIPAAPVSLLTEVSLWYKRTGSPNADPATIRLVYSDSSFTDVSTDPGATGWTFLNLTPALDSGKNFLSLQISAGGAGQSVYFDDICVNPVPAPGAAALGVLGLGVLARRRR